MSDTTLNAPATGAEVPAATFKAAAQASCEECLGSGGWFRYEPALEPAPGLLYLSCLQCRGSGRTASAQA
jgi:hypothetical protein